MSRNPKFDSYGQIFSPVYLGPSVDHDNFWSNHPIMGWLLRKLSKRPASLRFGNRRWSLVPWSKFIDRMGFVRLTKKRWINISDDVSAEEYYKRWTLAINRTDKRLYPNGCRCAWLVQRAKSIGISKWGPGPYEFRGSYGRIRILHLQEALNEEKGFCYVKGRVRPGQNNKQCEVNSLWECMHKIPFSARYGLGHKTGLWFFKQASVEPVSSLDIIYNKNVA